MNVLYQPQPPPHKLALCLRTNTPHTDDTILALHDIQQYLTGLGFVITIHEKEKGHLHYSLDVHEYQTVVIKEKVEFFAHGLWEVETIEEEKQCQENT